MNPCCCMTPRTGAVFVLFYELFWSVYWIINTIVQIARVVYERNHSEEGKRDVQKKLPALVMFFSIHLTNDVMGLILCIVLMVGLKKLSKGLLKTWLVISSVALVLFIVYVVTQNVDPSENYTRIKNLSNIIDCVITAYCISVVYAFLRELSRIEEEPQVQIHPSAVDTIFANKAMGA